MAEEEFSSSSLALAGDGLFSSSLIISFLVRHFLLRTKQMTRPMKAMIAKVMIMTMAVLLPEGWLGEVM